MTVPGLSLRFLASCRWMVVATSMASGKDILEVVDIGTGGLLGH